jgi:hypothetical protein
MNGNNGNENDKLAALQKRMERDREKMAAERERLRQQKAKETERLYRIVGEAVVREADKDAEFRAKLIQALREVVRDERAREFLREKGWL